MSLIYEKIPLAIDIEALRDHFLKTVQPLPAVFQSDAFGGWSVLSSNGDYKDGWHLGHKLYQTPGMTREELLKAAKAAGLSSTMLFNRPTEIHTGPMADLVRQISEKGLNPRRARIIILKAGKASSWHRDGADDAYAVRLPVPIITNSGCLFEIETKDGIISEHLPADGSAYLIKVNRVHRVINHGDTDRINFVTNIYDTNRTSKDHRLSIHAF